MLQISQELVDEMVAHARADHPDEACGVIAGAEGSDRALDTLFSTLRDMGFDPAMQPDSTDMELRACPFVSSGLQPSPFLCAVHAGFLQETSDDATSITLVPRQHPNVCRLKIKPA